MGSSLQLAINLICDYQVFSKCSSINESHRSPRFSDIFTIAPASHSFDRTKTDTFKKLGKGRKESRAGVHKEARPEKKKKKGIRGRERGEGGGGGNRSEEHLMAHRIGSFK